MAAPNVLPNAESSATGLSQYARAEQSPNLAGLPVHVIAPEPGWVPVRLGELWEYRELLHFFVWRELKLRYKQTALGLSWALIRRSVTMIMFMLIFGRLVNVPSYGLPYPIFAFCALLPWYFFSLALTESSNSVVAQQRLLTKVYFPRLFMPLSSVCVGLADFLIAF